MASKAEIAELWKDIFQDSDEFVDLFFNRVYNPENTLVIEADGKPISALHMIPYEIKIGNRIVTCAYICGVCTRPSERGRGYMRRLMNNAMDEMRRRKYAATILIPAEEWLFDYYKRFGYDTVINISIEEYKTQIENEDLSEFEIQKCNDEKYFPYFDRKQRERINTIIHDIKDCETIRRDCEIDGGSVTILRQDNRIAGVAFETPMPDKKVLIKELLCDSEKAKNALIQHIASRHNAQTATIRLPYSIGKKANKYGLAHIFDKDITFENFWLSLMLD